MNTVLLFEINFKNVRCSGFTVDLNYPFFKKKLVLQGKGLIIKQQ